MVLRLAAAQSATPAPSELLETANADYRSLHFAEAARLYREYLTCCPDRVDVRVYLGACLLNLNQLEQSRQEAQNAMRIEPRYAKAHTLLGRIYATTQSWTLAEQEFRQAIDLDPKDRDAWYFSGKACYSMSQFEMAVTSFRKALRLGASQSRVFDGLGLSYDALGQYDQAEAGYRRAVELAQGEYGPYFDYGVFLFRQRRTEESVSMLERAFQLDPDAADVRFEFARALYHSGNPDKALRVLQQTPASKECRVHNLLARIWAIKGNSEAVTREQDYLTTCVTTDSVPSAK